MAPIIQPAYDHHTLAERYRETIEMSRRKINREINHHNVRVRGKALQLDIVMQKIAGKNRDINRKFYEGRTSNLNPLGREVIREQCRRFLGDEWCMDRKRRRCKF